MPTSILRQMQQDPMYGVASGKNKTTSAPLTLSGLNQGLRSGALSTYDPSGSITGLTTLSGHSTTVPSWVNDTSRMAIQPTGTNTQQAAPVVDPYAQWGGKQAFEDLQSDFGQQKNVIHDTARESAQNFGIGLRNNVLDYLDSIAASQQKVDNRGINNEMARKAGTSSVLDMVNRGIDNSGTMLANRNATNSSAAERIAKIYGKIGRREQANVNRQYEGEQRDIGLAQDDIMRQVASGARNLRGSKEQQVNSLVTEARNNLAALDTQMVNASMPERIELEREKNKIKQAVMNELKWFDGKVAKGEKKATPSSDKQRKQEAFRLFNAGTPPEQAFNFTTQMPGAIQEAGAAPSNLPIFLRPPEEK